MGLVTTRAIVLQTYRYSDTSKILRLMTWELGPRSAIAKGALRPRSRFGGLLEPFAEGEATLYVKERRDLHTLSGFALLRDRQALGRDLSRFTCASVLCELVMRLAPEHRDDRLFGVLREGLDGLAEAEAEVAVVRGLSAVWRAVGALGFAVDLDRCLECGRAVQTDEGGRFDFAAGGLRCMGCSPQGRRLEPAVLASLRQLAGQALRCSTDGPEGRRNAGSAVGPQGALAADFIRYHLAEGTRLRSLDFLAQLPPDA